MVPPPLLLRAATSTSSVASSATAAATSVLTPGRINTGHRPSCAASPSTSAASSSSSKPFSTKVSSRPRGGSDPGRASDRNTRLFHTTRPSLLKGDPYAALGVNKSASAKEIKAAYYDLAKKLHPDVNKDKSDKAKEKFVEIQEAYDVLSDSDKKASYDRYGTTGNPFDGSGGGAGGGFHSPFGAGGGFGGFGGFQGFPGGGGRGTTSAEDIFESLFGAFGGGGGAGGGRSRGAGFAGESRGDDLETGVNITFEEACRGTTRNVTITPIERCSTCTGSGLKKGARKSTCKVCNGTGQRTFVIQSGFQMASTCPACGGAGKSVNPEDSCTPCDGVGRVRGKKTVQVKIPPGVDEGAKIRLEGAGDAPLEGNGPAGSLFVRINVKPSTVWRRQGSNLHYAAKVPLHVALLGGKVRVPTLDGDVDVRVPAGTQVGDEMLLKGRGVQSLMRRGDKGDLLVGFQVSIPRSLTKRQRDILQMYADEVEGRTAPSSSAANTDTSSPGGSSKPSSRTQSSPKSPASPSAETSSNDKRPASMGNSSSPQHTKADSPSSSPTNDEASENQSTEQTAESAQEDNPGKEKEMGKAETSPSGEQQNNSERKADEQKS
ncbi:unnamed protein product [Sympodiomycopsis kandeliae]